MHSTTHKISFPGLHGVKAWGTYAKVKQGPQGPRLRRGHRQGRLRVRGGRGGLELHQEVQTNVGAVAFGYHQSICRDMTLRFSAHAKVYTFTANNKGQINHRSKTKNLF